MKRVGTEAALTVAELLLSAVSFVRRRRDFSDATLPVIRIAGTPFSGTVEADLRYSEIVGDLVAVIAGAPTALGADGDSSRLHH